MRTHPGVIGVPALMLLVLSATPAAHAGNRADIGDHNDIVVAECADGGTVAGPLKGSASTHERWDKDGNLVSVAIAMEYKMTWTLSTTGETVSPHGARRILLNFADGTITESGNYRKLTISHDGSVPKYAGHAVYDMVTGETLLKHGPSRAEDTDPTKTNDIVCGLFGQDGA